MHFKVHFKWHVIVGCRLYIFATTMSYGAVSSNKQSQLLPAHKGESTSDLSLASVNVGQVFSNRDAWSDV